MGICRRGGGRRVGRLVGVGRFEEDGLGTGLGVEVVEVGFCLLVVGGLVVLGRLFGARVVEGALRFVAGWLTFL